MAKPRLSLTIEQNLLDLAKASGLNLSAEFEEFLRIRLNAKEVIENKGHVDLDNEIAQHEEALIILKNKRSLVDINKSIKDQINYTLDYAIDSALEQGNKLEDLAVNRSRGVSYIIMLLSGIAAFDILTRKLNKSYSELDAQKLLEDRIKERGLKNGHN